MKPYARILESIDNEFTQALSEFRSDAIFSSSQTVYTDEEKRRIHFRWMRIVRPFRALRQILRSTYWRSFFLRGNKNIFVIKYAATITYYNMVYELQKSFGPHEEFIRQYLDDTFSENYSTLARYMYRVRFYSTILYPHEYFLSLKSEVHPSLLPIFSRPDRAAGDVEKRFAHDRINIWYYIRYRLSLIYTWISKHGWNIMALIHFTRRRHGLISSENIDQVCDMIEPGDIILTRHNWVATNLGIPGFWKHMSMYVGTGRFLREAYHMVTLGDLYDDEHYIIEAVGTGVRMVPFSVLAGQNDYLSIMRPRFSEEKKSRAIKKLLHLLGEEYDYSFNFYSDANYVCSTLVMKSYMKETESYEWINITLTRIGTGITYPPNDLVKKMKREQKNPEIEFIAFIDANEKRRESFLASEKSFLDSGEWSRLSFFLD